MSVDRTLLNRLPTISETLFAAKASKKLSFQDIATKLGRNEVWVASLFYGQAKPEQADIDGLSACLDVDRALLDTAMGDQYFPDKGKLIDLPPRDPLLYRLYEIVANFGYAYKAIIHEKFGDGIMSAIAYNTNVEKVMVDGDAWVKITMQGKFLPYKRF